MIYRRIMLSLAVGSACTSCGHYTYDNARVRALQAASLDGLPMTPIAGYSIDDFFGPRTVLILPETSVLVQGDGANQDENVVVDLGGRAAPISEDGYYLTAHHVVSDSTPMMALPPQEKAERVGRFSFATEEAQFSRGRVVKSFLPADLALIKFNRPPQAYFKTLLTNHLEGLPVFTGSTIGFTMSEGKVGNGRFRAAGVILRIEPIAGIGSGRRIFTSIVARGGMSGAPVADAEGNLAGILVAGKWSGITRRYNETTLDIVPVQMILKAIEEDRRIQGIDQTHGEQGPARTGFK
jgi:hypothetical protein